MVLAAQVHDPTPALVSTTLSARDGDADGGRTTAATAGDAAGAAAAAEASSSGIAGRTGAQGGAEDVGERASGHPDPVTAAATEHGGRRSVRRRRAPSRHLHGRDSTILPICLTSG